jgi:hypothetical protein
MSALALTVVGALAIDPRCGAALKGSDLATRLVAIAQHESGGDPLTIGINADPAHGLLHATLHLSSEAEAVTAAHALLAAGRSIDLGLMGINARNLGSLTIETAFDSCANMREGATHFGRDLQAVVYDLAHRRYNTGSAERGAAYAASIEHILPAIRIAGAVTPPASEVNAALPRPTVLARPSKARALDYTHKGSN